MEEQLPLTKMTDEEIHGLSAELARIILKVKDMRQQAAEERKDWNEAIKGLEAQIDDLARQLREQEAARR